MDTSYLLDHQSHAHTQGEDFEKGFGGEYPWLVILGQREKLASWPLSSPAVSTQPSVARAITCSWPADTDLPHR